MKKLIPSIFAILFVIVSASNANAQLYQRAIGLRLGHNSGVTFKTKVAENHAIEILLNLPVWNNDKSFFLTGLYEVHADINTINNLKWYYGAGGSLGSRKHNGDAGALLAAIDGVIGLDYTFEKEPINIALDWKPALELAPNGRFNFQGFGISVRYTF